MGKDEKTTAEKFMELLRPIEREMEVYCRRVIANPQDAPDAIQNAVLRAFRAFDRYHEDASFRVWMFRILNNEIFAYNRKRGRIMQFEVPVEPEEMETLAALEQLTEYHDWLLSPNALADALDQNLVAALDTLTDTERAVLLLRAIGDFRYIEISESLDIPLGSVMGSLARARQKMRRAIMRSKGRATP